ncbi:MAG: AAA family ATPase [Thermaerobacter sp.]|nr:AAA family ATPase [Thermaerobacter sp.]
MVKEIGVGAGLAVAVFLALHGIAVAPLLVIAALAAAAMAAGGLNRFPPSWQMRTSPDTGPVRFQDIGGQPSATHELQEALEFLRDSERIEHLGIRPLRGILLAGPPGTGKTLLAKAAAQYTDSAFVAASGSEFVEMYAGVGAQRVRHLFQQARRLARREGKGRVIIFIDEIEVIAGRRGQNTSHLEYDQTLNQLLIELDGLHPHDRERVLLIAATNRAELLDSALIRPGRFDRLVRLDLPDREGRLQILRLHVRNKPLADDVCLQDIARHTVGWSGAHLESLCNEAAIFALRENRQSLAMSHFVHALDKVLLGEKTNRSLRAEDAERVAVHESGHALVAELVAPGSVSSVTITARGLALGFVRQTPADDRWLQTTSEMTREIQVCLAGAAAERLMLGDASTGAANDFEQAWAIARRMVLVGLSSLGVVHEEVLSPDRLHHAVREIIDTQQMVVDDLIKTHRLPLQNLAAHLLDQETLSGEAVRAAVAA